jgi:hypothetical protein
MKDHPLFHTLWYATHLLLVASFVMVVYEVTSEFATRNYLHGFADAVVPVSTSPEQKIEAILSWMKGGPSRREGEPDEFLASREPMNTLNYQRLLNTCGTATNAFVNLARSGGLRARRLLLLDEDRNTKHVVAEVNVEGSWVIVDPVYHVLLRDSGGRMLTRDQLRDQAVLREATQNIPNYPAQYTYERAVHIRVSRIPLVGGYLRNTLNSLAPQWEESIDWTLLVERKTFSLAIAGIFLACFALLARFILNWFALKRLNLQRVRPRIPLFATRVL